jgi:triacylglycerol lipase
MPDHSRLARLLQAACLLQVGGAIAWLAEWWPGSPLRALGGAVGILLIFPAVLGLELCLLPWVSRLDPTPRAGPAALFRAWVAEVRELLRVFYGRQCFRWREPPDHLPADAAGQTGVVFVHGFICNRAFWAPWMHRLRAEGRPCLAINLEPVFGSIDEYVPILDEAVQRMTDLTGEPPLLVCHSMGGLAARAWLRSAGNARAVCRVVTIGSPHQGTWIARFSLMPNGSEMREDSEWLAQLRQDEAAAPEPAPPFTCWYSNCDNVVFPPSNATLPGADNRFVPGPAHVDLAFHPEVMTASLALLEEEAAAAST